jgi:hypothetical protein
MNHSPDRPESYRFSLSNNIKDTGESLFTQFLQYAAAHPSLQMKSTFPKQSDGNYDI